MRTTMGFDMATLTMAVIAMAVPFLARTARADVPYYTDRESYQGAVFGQVPVQTFHSSDLQAPIYQINYWDAERIDMSAPYLFMSGNYGGWGPSIVSSKDLSLVWGDEGGKIVTQATTTGRLNGEQVLITCRDWHIQIFDQAYNRIHTIEPRGDLSGLRLDCHESSFTHDGTVVMIVCPAKRADLRGLGGIEDGRVLDCTVQEQDPITDEVLFEFSTLSYFGPEDSFADLTDAEYWDFAHMNSVEKTVDGNFIISYRHLSCVVLVDGRTSEVIWVMWGKRNMFTDVTDPGFGSGSAEFHFQHDPRFTGRNRFTLFDNHSMVNGFCDDDICSRGLEVEFDPDALTVRMVAEWYHPQRVSSGSRGGVQRTGGNSTLIAWGQNPLLTEHDADGRLAMDVQRGQVLPILHGIFPVLQYRVWKGDWEGRPSWPPSIACSRDDADARSLHVSWNGATEVDRYVLLSAEQATAIDGVESVVAQSPRNGFETKFNLHGLDIQRYVRIAALDAEGAILGSTGAVDTTNCAVIPLNYTVTDVFGGADRSLPDIPSSTSVVVPSGTGLAVYGFFKDVEVESDSEVTDDTENSGSDGQDNGEEETAVENGASKTKTTAGGEMPSGTSGDNASGLTTSNLFGVAAVAGSVSAITGLLVFIVYCIRRRQRIQGAFAIGAKGTPAYGLLRVDDLDHEDAGAGKHYIDIEEKEAAARLDGSEHERTPTR